MSSGGRDTAPEMAFRRALRSAGIGYRANVRGLPGTPDVVLAGSGLAVFVHGCFWHRHPGCRRVTTPKTSTPFWEAKFARNVARDRRKAESLRLAGWQVAVLWECEASCPLDLALAVEAVSEFRAFGSPIRLPRRTGVL